MKKTTALAILSSLFLLAACDSSGTDDGAAGGAGGAGGPVTPGTQSDLSTNVGDRVFFDYNSDLLTAESQATLERQAEWLKEYVKVSITIEGHADERGTREYNIALGERRASTAKNYLVSLGINSSRIAIVSYGKERPAVVGHDESAWSQNRRAVTVTTN